MKPFHDVFMFVVNGVLFNLVWVLVVKPLYFIVFGTP